MITEGITKPWLAPVIWFTMSVIDSGGASVGDESPCSCKSSETDGSSSEVSCVSILEDVSGC